MRTLAISILPTWTFAIPGGGISTTAKFSTSSNMLSSMTSILTHEVTSASSGNGTVKSPPVKSIFSAGADRFWSLCYTPFQLATGQVSV